MTEHIVTEHNDGILLIRMARPEKKNALTQAMYGALTEALTKADSDPAIRVAVLTGSEDSFSAGSDLGEFLRGPATRADSPVGDFLRTIAATQTPIVAAVNGLAIGIGTTLLLHCDLVHAAASARFQCPFVNLALVLEAASSLLLPRLAGHQRAAEIFMLGEPFDAATARELGLVNAVHDDAGLLEAVLDVARKLAAKPPAALRSTKALLKSKSRDPAARMAEELKHLATRLQSPEAREALLAFQERREPDFSKFE